MENLLLSADSDISLYEIKKEIFEILDDLCNKFWEGKNMDCYDETAFVRFIKNKYGDDSIKFIKVVGQCSAGDFNEELDRFEDLIQEEYKSAKRINF